MTTRQLKTEAAHATWCVARRVWCVAAGAGRVGFLALLLALALVFPASGQTNAPQSAPPENRYLLVVETSRSMQHRAPSTVNALGGLLASGFKDQLHPQDSIGLWTFNEDLHTGQFPLQRWSPQHRVDIADRVVTFLNEQHYEKEPNYDKLLPALTHVVQASPFITIVLVTDGEDKIHGTPFDDRINDTFQAWRERQQNAQMPFLTVLRARQGVITDCTVGAVPWPLEIPPLPPELRVVTVAAQPSAPSKPALPMAPPLIIHGKKPEPVQSSALEGTNRTSHSSGVTDAVLTQASATESSSTNAAVPAPLMQAQALVPQSPPASAAATKSSASVAAVGTRVASALPPPPAPVTAGITVSRKLLWLGAAVLASALLGLALLLFARARPASGPSLITQSLERQAK